MANARGHYLPLESGGAFDLYTFVANHNGGLLRRSFVAPYYRQVRS